MNADLTRRGFLKTTAGAAAAFGIPVFIPASALGRDGRPAPSERITIGQIGCGGNGSGHVRQWSSMDGSQVLAVCDVDRTHRETNRKAAEETYGQKKRSGSYKGCVAYHDFRELLARPDIDAVSISTPDHWHALVAIAACEAGKDIYCEKPISLTVREGRAMSDAVKKYGRVFQTGSQDRSIDSNRHAAELALNGYLGEIKYAHASIGSTKQIPIEAGMPIPDGFDYDFWLGPAPWEPYTERRCFGTFRFILDYSGGEITDHGAHYIDMAQWGLGTAYSGPVEFEGEGEYLTGGLFDTAESVNVRCKYANGIELTIGDGPHGTQFYGSKGSVKLGDGGAYGHEPASLRHVKIKPNELHLYGTNDHHQDFLDCVRTRRQPVAPVEQAHRTVTIAHIGNIAMTLKRKLRWDPDKERFIDDPEADRMLSRPMRAPWKLT